MPSATLGFHTAKDPHAGVTSSSQLGHFPSPFPAAPPSPPRPPKIESHSIVQDSLELAANLLPPGCWDSKQQPLRPIAHPAIWHTELRLQHRPPFQQDPPALSTPSWAFLFSIFILDPSICLINCCLDSYLLTPCSFYHNSLQKISAPTNLSPPFCTLTPIYWALRRRIRLLNRVALLQTNVIDLTGPSTLPLTPLPSN